jgi:hypothetical protein
MRGTGGRGWLRAVAIALGVAVAVGGCVGATPRDEFDAEVVERGGGLVPALPLDAIAALGAELGTEAAFRQITITPLGRVVSMTVQDPSRPENLDEYVVREGDLSGPRPVQLSGAQALESTLFSADDVPALGRLDELGATAVRELGIEDGVVTSVVVSRVAGDLRLLMAVESERARGTAVFTPDGELVEGVRS